MKCVSEAEEVGLNLTWSEIRKTHFRMAWLISTITTNIIQYMYIRQKRKEKRTCQMGFEPPPFEFIYQNKAVQPSLYGYERKVSGPIGHFREYTYTPFY